MTEAVTAQNDKLYVKIDGSWKKFGEVKTTPEVGEETAKLDASSLDSVVKEYIKDLPDQTDLTFTFNAIPVNAIDSNLKLLMDMSRSSSYEWKYMLSTLGIQYNWTGDFSYKVGAGAVSTVRELSLTIIPRTRPIESDISDKYTVSYDSNGGTGTMSDATQYLNGEEVSVKINTFSPPGIKTFTKWTTKMDGTGVGYDEGDTFLIYGDTTLFAQWRE